jgi:hypothetical protein
MDLTTLESVKTFLEVYQEVTETATIPGTAPYAVSVEFATLWDADRGVVYGATGVALVKVAANPTEGKYSVAAGVYTFAVADKSKALRISYQYTPEDKWQASWDDLVGNLIAAVSAESETYCNRGFEKVERTEYHDGGGRYLYLRATPVAEIDSIKGSDYWDWPNALEITSDSYGLRASAGMVQYRGGEWPYGVGAVQVVYTGGYDPYAATPPVGYVPIPADLENAVCREVAYRFRRRKDLGLQSVSFPDGSIQKMDTGQFLKEVRIVLDRFRRRVVG